MFECHDELSQLSSSLKPKETLTSLTLTLRLHFEQVPPKACFVATCCHAVFSRFFSKSIDMIKQINMFTVVLLHGKFIAFIREMGKKLAYPSKGDI